MRWVAAQELSAEHIGLWAVSVVPPESTERGRSSGYVFVNKIFGFQHTGEGSAVLLDPYTGKRPIPLARETHILIATLDDLKSWFDLLQPPPDLGDNGWADPFLDADDEEEIPD